MCQKFKEIGASKNPEFSDFMLICPGRRAHRNPRNLFILNLAVSGLLTVTVTLPPTLSQCLSAGRWFLGLTACKVVPTIQGQTEGRVQKFLLNRLVE